MRRAGRLAAEASNLVAEHVRPGVTTELIDQLVFEFAMRNGAVPATLNYRGYPKSCCTSLNHVVCHGIPGPRMLVEGDILNVDVTFIRRRLARQLKPHVLRGPHLAQGRAPYRGNA